MYVHALPTVNWGQEFLLAPFSDYKLPQNYTLVSSQDIGTTTVAYRCDDQRRASTLISKAGESTLLTWPRNSHCSLVSSRPIFVVHHRAFTGRGDYVTIISPTTRYVNNVMFTSLGSRVHNFIVITVPAEHFDPTQILLDGNQLSCSWIALPSITSEGALGYGCTVCITHGVHVVSHSGENGVISVVVHGFRSHRGYAYLAGINLDIDTETEGTLLCISYAGAQVAIGTSALEGLTVITVYSGLFSA
jgi:hypothetical protein